MTRAQKIAASRVHAARCAGQSIIEVTPSRRDFVQYVATRRSELAVIARLSAPSPQQRLAQAQSYDDAEAAALLLPVAEDGLTDEEVRSLSTAITAPVLNDIFVLHVDQIYQARLSGCDAVVVALPEVGLQAAAEMLSIASSLHMAVVVEVTSASEIEAASGLPRALIGLHCVDAAGELDLDSTVALARRVPNPSSALVLPEVSSLEVVDQLRGSVDAVVIGQLLANAENVSALLGRIRSN